MNSILLAISLWCGDPGVPDAPPAQDVREVLDQRLYEDGYRAKINVLYWGVIASSNEEAFRLRMYVCAVAWIIVAVVLGYSCYADKPGLFFGVIVPSLAITVLAIAPASVKCGTSNRIQDRWRHVAHRCDSIQRELELLIVEPSDRLIDDVETISDEILSIENEEPPMRDPDADRKLLAKCQHEQNIAQGSVEE